MLRKQIIDAIVTDLKKIKSVNGYNNTVLKVYKKTFELENVKEFPSFAVSVLGDNASRTSEGYLYHQSTYGLIGYLQVKQDTKNEGILTDLSDSLYQDVLDLFQTNTDTERIEGVEFVEVKGMASFLDDNNLKGFIVIELKINYYED